jgi:hypothetical protein
VIFVISLSVKIFKCTKPLKVSHFVTSCCKRPATCFALWYSLHCFYIALVCQHLLLISWGNWNIYSLSEIRGRLFYLTAAVTIISRTVDKLRQCCLYLQPPFVPFATGPSSFDGRIVGQSCQHNQLPLPGATTSCVHIFCMLFRKSLLYLFVVFLTTLLVAYYAASNYRFIIGWWVGGAVECGGRCLTSAIIWAFACRNWGKPR